MPPIRRRAAGRLHPEPPSRHPQRLPARLRPHHPFDRLPPAEAQDPGLRVPRGRPLPHPADPYARGRRRSPARSRARSGSTRISPRRWRSPTTSAIRRSAMPASARSTMPRALWRLRSQRADPAGGDRARAALCGFRRAQPHLGNAGRPGQAQRPADRSHRRADRALSASAACRRRSATMRRSRTCDSGAMPAPRRRSAAIADDIAYDAHDIDDGLRAELVRARRPRRGAARRRDRLREICARASRARACALDARTGAPPDHPHDRGRDCGDRSARLARLAPHSADDVRARGRAGGRRSRPRWRQADRAIKDFLYPRMYRHARIMRDHGGSGRRGARPVRALHRAIRPTCRRNGGTGLDRADEAAPRAAIADFIAGMTDRYALIEHARLLRTRPRNCVRPRRPRNLCHATAAITLDATRSQEHLRRLLGATSWPSNAALVKRRRCCRPASTCRASWSSRRAMPSHGDMATNAAMVLAKDAGKKPRELADAIADEAARRRPESTKVEVAGPGFINLTLKPRPGTSACVRRIAPGADYGRSDDRAGRRKVNVEYVSANPTGPMHVGHCRGAVFGDALANLLAFAGYRGHARILHQRCRRAGRCARALGLSALPRGARRRHRRDPGRALSRRLSEAGRRGARSRIRRRRCKTSRKSDGCRSCAPRPST